MTIWLSASCSRRLRVPLSSLTPITPPSPRRGAPPLPPQPSSIPLRDLSTSLDDCPEERQFVYAGIQSQLAEPLLLGATSETQQLTVNKQAVSHVRIRPDSCLDRHARQWIFYKPSPFFLSIPCSLCETVSAAGGLQKNILLEMEPANQSSRFQSGTMCQSNIKTHKLCFSVFVERKKKSHKTHGSCRCREGSKEIWRKNTWFSQTHFPSSSSTLLTSDPEVQVNDCKQGGSMDVL